MGDGPMEREKHGVSNPARECLRRFFADPSGACFERLKRLRLIKVNHGIELIQQPSMKIVANALAFRAVNDTDGTLQARWLQRSSQLLIIAQHQQKPVEVGFMKKLLLAPREPRPNPLALGGSAPIRRRSDRSPMGAESDQHGFPPVGGARQLAYVPFTRISHFSRTRVTQVGIVGPHCNARRLLAARQICNQRFESVYHVAIAQVPRRNAAAEHRPIVGLCIFNEPPYRARASR